MGKRSALLRNRCGRGEWPLLRILRSRHLHIHVRQIGETAVVVGRAHSKTPSRHQNGTSDMRYAPRTVCAVAEPKRPLGKAKCCGHVQKEVARL